MAAPRTRSNPDVATVPFHLEGNRPFVELTFKKANEKLYLSR